MGKTYYAQFTFKPGEGYVISSRARLVINGDWCNYGDLWSCSFNGRTLFAMTKEKYTVTEEGPAEETKPVIDKKFSAVTLSAKKFNYDGKAHKPKVTVKDGTKILKESTDYTVTIKDSKGKKVTSQKTPGKYTIYIIGKNSYNGIQSKIEYTIVPKSTSISKVTAGKKQLTLKWTKQTKETTGYQIIYSTDSSFKTYKTVTISKNSTTSKKITGLKAKKKYYVKVRTYKTVNGVKYYSNWSKVKQIKTK